MFQDGWLTAHELSKLKREDEPGSTGEIFKVETRNLRKIKEILDRDLSDREFRARLVEIRPLLPRPFEEMEGIDQLQSHGDIDPVDHTLYALEELNTKDLSSKDRLIARTVLMFHDVGKVYDAYSREHPRRSADITRDYLVKMGYSANQIRRIIHHIRWHDALGDVARTDGSNIFDERDVVTFFPDEAELRLHQEIVIADVASIPGLARYVPNIQRIYRRLLEKLADHQAKKVVEPGKELPFKPVGVYHFHRIHQDLYRSTEFDDVDIAVEMASRNADFEALSAKDQEIVEKTIIQEITRGSPRALNALKLTGRETDETFEPRSLPPIVPQLVQVPPVAVLPTAVPTPSKKRLGELS